MAERTCDIKSADHFGRFCRGGSDISGILLSTSVGPPPAFRPGSPFDHARASFRLVWNAFLCTARGVFCSLSVLSVAIVAHLIQLGSAILVYPFSPGLLYRVSSRLTGTIWTVMNFVHERLCGALFSFSGDIDEIPLNDSSPFVRLPDGSCAPESAIVISNHLCDIDWMLINALARRYNMLDHCKYFIKRSLLWVPVFGIGMMLAGFPTLKRNWSSDQKSIYKVFDILLQHRLPCWLISFLEGTRLTRAKLAESQEFCRSRGLSPVLHNVLYPRKKGFIATLSALRGCHVTHVYDLTLAYFHLPSRTINQVFPSILESNSTNLSSSWRFHVHVDRIPISSLPSDSCLLDSWIDSRWRIKDARLAAWKDKWCTNQETQTLAKKLD